MAKIADEVSADSGATHYSVREVVRATGIGEHTLRAWERRYGAVVPNRSKGGTRRYTRRDLARLVDLKRAVDTGHRIGEISNLSDSELAALPARRTLRRTAPDADSDAPPWRAAFDTILRFEAAEAERLLSLDFSALGPARFGREVALPLLGALGQGWHDGEVSPAAEHLASSIIRNLLGIALRSRPRGPHAFTLVTTTLTGERHEAGLLVAALIAADAGLRVVHLGVELPAVDIALAASQVGADAVLLAMTVPNEGAAIHLEELDRELPESVEIWTGGPAGSRQSARRKCIEFNDFSEIEVHLRSLEKDAVDFM